ncbi:MAG: phosphoribosyl-AMP cyclohydrolase [Gammaproteobacteria bacterium]|nr:MAG: phosphoribosyl-AMP cyclohydrolase [Gammaproteobacteria bacterium]
MTKYNDINSTEVENFLNSWKDGVIDIGKAYQEGIDYREKAKNFVETHYAFDIGDVLFKPTFTNDVVFRNNLEDALSYFVTGDISEDSGFAIKPWEEIKTSEVSFILDHNLCAVMGVLDLKPLNSENKTKIAFTFILVKDNDRFKIKIHHSSEIK